MSWYIVSTPRHQERQVKKLLASFRLPEGLGERRGSVLKTYLPLRKVADTDKNGLLPLENVVPAIPGLLFVHGSLRQLQYWLEETATGCRLYVNVNNNPIVVPDYQIRLFKDYLSFVDSEVMVLRKPYSYFLQKKRIRILNGPFVGLEGRLFQIKGNYKLVYGLGNTALALSDIARYTYVEVTDEPASRLRYSFYYEAVSSDVDALLAEEAPAEEVLARLQHWRQEASVLSQESPLASGYVSLSLQQVLADLYDQQHAFLRDEKGVGEVASIYQDTLDYLDLAQASLDDEVMVRQLEARRQVMSRRALYLSDPLHLVEQMEEEGTTRYGFVRRQEGALRKVEELLASAASSAEGQPIAASSAEGQPTGASSTAEKQEEAFSLLVSLFDEVANKLSQTSYQNHLDSVANYRLRRLLGVASRQYRRCREGQGEEFVKRYQSTLRRLLRRPVYQSHGFFDLLRAVKNANLPEAGA